MRISSLQNARIKHIAKLRDDAGQRKKDGLMLVEGQDEINLARAAGHAPLTILTSPELVMGAPQGSAAEVLEVTPTIFKKLSFRQNPDGWLAVFRVPAAKLEDLSLVGDALLIVVESVEKPGNLGAILRTCDAAGVDGVIVCDPRADIYGPNVVRASRGTVFTVPIAVAPGPEVRSFLRARGIRIAAASPAAQVVYTREDLRGPLAIAVGTEDRGLSESWMTEADVVLQIPMRGKINSLNVSVAAALLLFEAVRQRQG